MIFFKITALRVSIAETLSTVSKAKARSATLWGRVEKLSAVSRMLFSRMLLFIFDLVLNIV